VLVEGHGDIRAVQNLTARLLREHGHAEIRSLIVNRWKNLHLERGIESACTFSRRERDLAGLLVIRDEDDGCPAKSGPATAHWLRKRHLPFPAAAVLMHREYEVLFLPCIHLLAGRPILDESGKERPGLRSGTTLDQDPEGIRNVKGWLTQHFPSSVSYKPTLDQLPLTRMLDLEVLRAASLGSFRRLENAIRFFKIAGPGDVYPPAVDDLSKE
jgi:hypothetical protein